MAKKAKSEGFELDGGMLLWGMFFGLLAGGIATLLTAPKSGPAFRRQLRGSVEQTTTTLRERAESIVPTDPVEESLAEGKAAARRRRAELGVGVDPAR
jgi:gas vesicle protein